MGPITTHVLDTSLGCPAEGIAVVLYRVNQAEEATEIGRGSTNSDGRVMDLLPASEAQPGTYRIVFNTASYFAESGRQTFYPRVEILFETLANENHYHVPLLLSPFGYSTYRGS